MKKIFYICTHPIENWDIFTQKTKDDKTQSIISVLFLHEDYKVTNVSFSEVWTLTESTTVREESNYQQSLSYQTLLEKIFSNDLSLVI